MRKFYLVLSFFLMASLHACTVESNRIYTICAIKEGNTYCYNDDGFFVLNNETGSLLEVNGYGLYKKPVIQLLPTHNKDFKFENSLPGLYVGTLESVSNYVYFLESEYNSTTEIIEADSNSIEILCTSTEMKTRIVYNIRGEVRIYSIDSNGDSTSPIGVN